MEAPENYYPEISETDAKEFKDIFNKRGLEGLQRLYKKKINEWKDIPLNIAIIGESGSGKSTFINAVRNLSVDDEGAAKADIVETTINPKPYPHPTNKMLIFWDLPGLGTRKFPKDEYLKAIKLKDYDFFLILTCDRFTENDIWLASEIHQIKKRFFFVRTKFHMDILNESSARRNNPRPEKALTEAIKENIRKNLQGKDLYDERNIFVIDNYQQELYDFGKLINRIIEDSPAIKQEVLIMSLTLWNADMIKKKAKTMRKYMYLGCLMSGIAGAAPVPGLSIAADILIIVGQANAYFNYFGLDDESLKRLATTTSRDPNALLGVVKKRVSSFLTSQGLATFIRGTPIVLAAIAAEEGTRFIPIIGSIIACPASFASTFYILNIILNEMEKTALEVVKRVFGYTDVIFVIHGIGQKMVENIDEAVKKIRGTLENQLTDTNVRPIILPIQWRTTADVSDEIFKELSHNQNARVQERRDQFYDVFYYLANSKEGSRQMILKENLIYQLNKAYDDFIKENSDFKGKVSLLAHSLGSVITYDVLKTSNALNFFVENFFAIGSPLGLWLALRETNHIEILEATDNFKYFFNINFSDDIVSHKIEPLFKTAFQKWDNSFTCAPPTEIIYDQVSFMSLDSWNIDFSLPSTEGLLHKIPYYPEIIGILNHSIYWESKDLMNFIIQVLHKGSRKATAFVSLQNHFQMLIRDRNRKLLSEIENTQKKIKFNSETAASKSEEVIIATKKAKSLIFVNFEKDSVMYSTSAPPQTAQDDALLELQAALAALQTKNNQRREVEIEAERAIESMKLKTIETNAFKNQVAKDQELLEKLKREYDNFKKEVSTFCKEWKMPYVLDH